MCLTTYSNLNVLYNKLEISSNLCLDVNDEVSTLMNNVGILISKTLLLRFYSFSFPFFMCVQMMRVWDEWSKLGCRVEMKNRFIISILPFSFILVGIFVIMTSSCYPKPSGKSRGMK